jgi:hypothetical protein
MSTPGTYDLSREGSSPATNVVHAAQFIRKMRGGSQPALIRCDDDKLYVVKFLGNRQGPNLLANEVLGSELLLTCGLPTPRWKPIFVSPAFLKENSNVAFETPFGNSPIESGLHFGSEFLGGGDTGDVYEWLPNGLSSRVINLDDFLGIQILDVWANHCDHRQALFTVAEGNASFCAVFIDNGHLFGGPGWELVSRRGESLGVDRRFHTSIQSEEAIDAWIRRFEERCSSSLFDVVPRIPKFWYSGDINRVIGSLADRLSTLKARFAEEPTQKQMFSRLSRMDRTDAKLSLHHLDLPLYGDRRKRPASCPTSGLPGGGRQGAAQELFALRSFSGG